MRVMESYTENGECPPEILEEDILEAMKSVKGYLDITPGDFKTLYILAYKQAVERLMHSVKAHDIMTRKVISAKRDTPLAEVAQTMAVEGVSGVPVVDDGQRVVGVISDKDFVLHMGGEDLRSFMGVVAHCLTSRKCVALLMRHQTAGDIMAHPAVTVTEKASVSDVTDLMAMHNINRVPVTDEEGKLIGIIARANIVQSSCAVIMPPKT
jgi:CBS-domain-containing membrane protein